MAYYLVKVIVSAILIVLISEVGDRRPFIGAVLASVPTVSLLAFIWIYVETGDVAAIADLARSIFYLVIPSLVLFLLLPYLLARGWDFWGSLVASMLATGACYGGMVWMLRWMNIQV